MGEAHETVIVGGGQAGLALSHHLSQLGREHVVLERGRVAERWRSERWDSLAFQFPNWSIRLPGHEYRGDDLEGFAPRDEVVRFIERYADLIRAPVRLAVNVVAVFQKPGSSRFAIETDGAALEAVNVVIATGPYQKPALPPAHRDMPSDLFQVHSSRYRNPAALPPGAVLVAGSGASGCQIAEDLLEAGRTVYLSVGRHSRKPRRYRGRDVFWWIGELGALDQTVDQRGPRRLPNPLVTGAGGGHDIDLRDYAARGATLLGRLHGVRDGALFLADDLDQRLAEGDEGFTAFTRAVDEHVSRTGTSAAEDRAPSTWPRLPAPPGELDLRAAGIASVVWASGFRSDFDWVRAPVLDERGAPVHRRGVTRTPGLYFLGLAWLHKLKSSVLCGVGEDAAYIAEHIARRG